MTVIRGLLILALASLTVVSCNRSNDTNAAASATPAAPARSGNHVRFDPASSQLERIHVAPATSAVLPVDELDVPATIEAVPTRLVRLALPVPGRVRTVTVALGDHVREGRILLTFETPEVSQLQSALRQAQADGRQRRAALDKAEADASRARDLLANQAIAQKEVLAAENELAAARAAVDQARAAETDVTRRLQLFGVNAEQQDAVATLRAPVNGEVTEVSVAPGEYRSDTAAPLLAVADLARIWAVASVPETAVGRVHAGQPVSVTVAAYPDQPFDGRVTRIAGAVDPDTRSVRIIAELDNRDGRLKPGMFARVRYSGPARAVVTVPPGAIVQDEQRTTVFVERATGEFERRDVVLGPRHPDAVVVTTGLNNGERVVVDGTMLLMSGQ